jgi:hypothetical protein
MRKIQLSLLICTAIFFTGCPKYRPTVDFNRNGFVKQVNDFFDTKQKEYFTALNSNDPATAKLRRNELIEKALPYIDEAYMDFITALQSGRDRDNFLLDVVELGTTGAVGITKGQRPLQILGVALTAFRGGRRSADLNFYKEQTTPVLINKMDGNRANVRAIILQNEAKDVDAYPIGRAVGEIVDYYNAGTLVRAFTELQKDTAEQTKISERAHADPTNTRGVGAPPTTAQIEESKQNFAVVNKIVQVWTNARDAKAAAQKIIDLERAKQPPNVPDQTEITKQQGVIKAQEKIQQDVLDDFQSLFDLIQADSKLKPFIEQIPVAASGGDPGEQQLLRTSLNKIKSKDPNTPPANRPDIFDYNSIFLALNGLVSEAAETDPSIRGRLKAKLLTSKTINQTP